MKHFNTVMQQCLQFLPNDKFKHFVGQHNGDKWTKHFTAYNHLSVMIYAQATGKTSLRDIQTGLQIQAKHWYHLNLKSVSKSTIADANNRRDYKIFENLFYALLERCKEFIPRRKFDFKNDLYSLDGSIIDLCLNIFDWAKFRKTKGAIKLHTLFNNKNQIPEFLTITTRKVHEVTETKNTWKKWDLPKESILAIDRGYIDLGWFYELNKSDIYFVTRTKSNTNYFVLQENNVSEKGVVSDQVIGLGSDNGLENYPENVRLITYYDKEKDKLYRFITNNFELSAKTIADIYKERWQIELFFKWIKQHLRIKTFLGTSKNAVMTQVWIAMIYFLIIAYIKAQTKTSLSMLELARIFSEAFMERVLLIDLLSLKPASISKVIRSQTRAFPRQMTLF